jgi:DNA polymerase-3 subunit delta
MDFFTFRKNLPDLDERGAVFVSGDEAYLRSTVVDLLADEHDLDTHRVSASDTDPSHLDELLQGQAFQDRKQLVCLVDRGGSFIKKHDEWVKNQVKKGGTDHYLLIEAPGANKNLNIRSWLTEEAIHVSCETPERNRVENWLKAFFQSEDLRIASETVSNLVDRVGLDLTLLREEMEKLAMYCRDEGRVHPDDLKDVVVDRSEMDFFDFTDAWLESKHEPVLKEIRQQLLRGESDVKITGSLLWAFRRLRSIIELSKMGRSPGEISSELGVRKWVVENTCRQFRSLDEGELAARAREFLKKDLLARTGSLDPELALELMVLDGLEELPVLEER